MLKTKFLWWTLYGNRLYQPFAIKGLMETFGTVFTKDTVEPGYQKKKKKKTALSISSMPDLATWDPNKQHLIC